jgi:hypothetical protein
MNSPIDNFLAMLQEYYSENYNDAHDVSIRVALEREGATDQEWLTKAYNNLVENFDTKFISKGQPKIPMVKDILRAIRICGSLGSAEDPYAEEYAASMNMKTEDIVAFISKARSRAMVHEMTTKERAFCGYWGGLWAEWHACDALGVSPQFRENHVQTVRDAIVQGKSYRNIWQVTGKTGTANIGEVLKNVTKPVESHWQDRQRKDGF